MIRVLSIVLFMLIPASGHAAYFAGLSLDASSNMLLRPDGDSGMLTSFYGGFQKSFSRAIASYTVDSGFLQHYEGLQYHRHHVDLGMSLVTSVRGTWTVTLQGDLARYGDVASLTGYEQFGADTTVKYYLTPQTLLRWQGVVARRQYREYSSENYDEYETFLRLDRFFGFGLTLRGQAEFGARRYTAYDENPLTSRAGIRLRAAKSISTGWGVWVEAYATDIIATDTPEDISGIFDRLFLDDPYKYTKTGMVLNIKHLLLRRGMAQLRTSMLVRRYDGSLSGTYWYLPPGGWDERETGVYMTVMYPVPWIPEMLTPSADLYYIDVDASEDYLSYRSYGATVRFDF